MIFSSHKLFLKNLFVCKICFAQHKHTVCTTSMFGAAFRSVLKVKPVFARVSCSEAGAA